MLAKVEKKWSEKRLGDVATLTGGTTPSRSDARYWENGDILWATPTDVTALPDGVQRISKTSQKITSDALAECSLKLHAPGTVLMTSRATIGYAAINDAQMATNQGFIAFQGSEELDSNFLCQWLNSNREQLKAAAGGSTFKEISRTTAKSLKMLLPPLDEQRRIAEVLRTVDEAIQSNCLLIDKLKLSLDAIGMEFFSVKSNEEGTLLGDIITLEYGKSLPKNLRQEGKIGVYGSNGKVGTHSEALIHKQGIVIGRKGTAGSVTVTDGPFWPIDTTYYVVPKAELNFDWLVFALVHARLDLLSEATGVPGLNRDKAYQAKIMLPSLDEQIEIAENVSSISKLILKTQNTLENIKQIKTQISSDLLSGRVRVPA